MAVIEKHINNAQYIKRFEKNLNEYNNKNGTSYTFKDVQDKFISVNEVKKEKDDDNNKKKVTHCMCGHAINNEYEIINPETGDMMILGSDCITTYMLSSYCNCQDCGENFKIYNNCQNLCKNCKITTKKCKNCKKSIQIKNKDKKNFKLCNNCKHSCFSLNLSQLHRNIENEKIQRLLQINRIAKVNKKEISLGQRDYELDF